VRKLGFKANEGEVMRRITLMLAGAAAATCLTLAGSARAQGSGSGSSGTATGSSTGKQGSSSSSQDTKGKTVQGKVKSVDKKSNEVTLSSGEHLKLDPNASLTKGGKAASIDDLKEGDQVRASMSGDQANTVITIIVEPTGSQ